MRFLAAIVMAICFCHQPLVCQSAEKEDPTTQLWRNIKHQLSGPNGREYFERYMKDAQLPTLYGTVVSGSPGDHPNRFLVTMPDSTGPEVTLRLAVALEKPMHQERLSVSKVWEKLSQ